MVQPFVLPDESLRKLAAFGKWTLELEVFLAVMNCLNVAFEIVVTSEGNSVRAAFLWAKQRVDVDVLEVCLEGSLGFERCLGRAARPLAVLLLTINPLA